MWCVCTGLLGQKLMEKKCAEHDIAGGLPLIALRTMYNSFAQYVEMRHSISKLKAFPSQTFSKLFHIRCEASTATRFDEFIDFVFP